MSMRDWRAVFPSASREERTLMNARRSSALVSGPLAAASQEVTLVPRRLSVPHWARSQTIPSLSLRRRSWRTSPPAAGPCRSSRAPSPTRRFAPSCQVPGEGWSSGALGASLSSSVRVQATGPVRWRVLDVPAQRTLAAAHLADAVGVAGAAGGAGGAAGFGAGAACAVPAARASRATAVAVPSNAPRLEAGRVLCCMCSPFWRSGAIDVGRRSVRLLPLVPAHRVRGPPDVGAAPAVAVHPVAADQPLRPPADQQAEAKVAGERVADDHRGDPVSQAVTAQPDAGAGVAGDDVVAQDRADAPGRDARALRVAPAAARVALDHVAERVLLDLDALRRGHDLVVVHPVAVGRVRAALRVAAGLLRRGPEVDALAVLGAPVGVEPDQAAALDPVAGDLVVGGAGLEPDALVAGVVQVVVEHPYARRTLDPDQGVRPCEGEPDQ